MTPTQLLSLIRTAVALRTFDALAESIPAVRTRDPLTGEADCTPHLMRGIFLGFDEADLAQDVPAAVYLCPDNSLRRLTVVVQYDEKGEWVSEVGLLESVSLDILRHVDERMLLTRLLPVGVLAQMPWAQPRTAKGAKA